MGVPPSMPSLPAYGILALGPDQIRLLAVAVRVPWAKGEPDCRVWARMVGMPLPRVRALVRGLIEMGAIEPDGALPKVIRDYLALLGRVRLTAHK